jgi:hypothetical protein
MEKASSITLLRLLAAATRRRSGRSGDCAALDAQHYCIRTSITAPYRDSTVAVARKLPKVRLAVRLVLSARTLPHTSG